MTMMQRKLIIILAIWHVLNVGGRREIFNVAITEVQDVLDKMAK